MKKNRKVINIKKIHGCFYKKCPYKSYVYIRCAGYKEYGSCALHLNKVSKFKKLKLFTFLLPRLFILIFLFAIFIGIYLLIIYLSPFEKGLYNWNLKYKKNYAFKIKHKEKVIQLIESLSLSNYIENSKYIYIFFINQKDFNNFTNLVKECEYEDIFIDTTTYTEN